MTTSTISAPKAPPRWRHFLRHAAEMTAAMLVGMELLGPLWAWLGGALDRPDVAAFVAATDMTVAMTVWMRYRGHGLARTVEMGAAMYVPYLVLLVPFWLGVLPGENVLMGGHVLMLPAMAVAMLTRREGYSCHHDGTAHPLIRVLGQRWPTWIALAVTFDSWADPGVPPAWTLLLLQSAYLFFGGIRGRLRNLRTLVFQLAGFAGFLALAVVASTAAPVTAALVVAAAFAAHAVWDLAHHIADAVVPRWWAEGCGVVDLIIAVTIVLMCI